ncbi:YncE family protein [Pseudomonas sp. B26140]|uniref:YncE family protein n=1 Tax=Pseudomonas sp. B26140 TaxID=3235112 RepID=UPI003785138A
MSANDLPENSTLTLKELDIPGRTGPVSEEPEIWGINRAAAHDNFPRQGLLCRAGPWDVMSIGDALDIKIEGQQVEKKIVKEHEVGTELQMFVPAARLHEGPLTVSYTVTRLNQTPENSEVSRYLFKDTLPGGHDEDDGPGHSKLIMSIPPEIISGGIDKDNVADGFLITIGKADGLPPYPFAAAGDRIQVSVGGVFVLNEGLTQDQADGKTAITIHIGEATLREAGDSDSKGLAVVFEVYDLVDNRSEDWSFEQRVVVAIDTTLLDAPLLEEAVNNVLDVDKLGTADGTAQIVALDPSKFKVGDIIILRIKGTPVEGAPIDIEIKSEPLVSVPSIVNISVPNAVLGQFAKTQFALSFWLPSADGSPKLRSKTQFISAIGEVQRLAAPVVRDASDGALDPTLEQVVFLIPFDESFVAGDSIELHCLIIRSDLTPYLLKLPLRTITNGDIAAKEPLQINASRDPLLDLAKGGTMEAYYLSHIASTVLGTMNRVNATHTTRESIHAEILQVGEPRLELPEPEVAGVVNGVMPPDRDGTTLTVSYLDTHPGDVVTYCWVGSKTGTVCDSITLNSFTAGKPIQFTIGAGLIKNNKGGMVEAKYSIKLAAGGTSYSNPLTFRVGVALELKAPAIEQAPNGSTLDPFAAQDALTAIINYDMRIGDKITVTLTGAPGTPAGGSHTTAPVNVTTIGAQKIEIDTSVLAFNFGKSVSVHCTVSRDGESKDSQLLLLAVLPIKDHDHRLPSPIINGNTSSELDTTTLARGAKTRIARWSHNAQGQPLWLLYLKDDDPTPFAITYEATPTPAAGLPNGMYPDTPVAALKALPNGARVRIEFRVGFDHSPDESKAVTFPVRTYTIKAVEDLKPQITSIKGSPSGDEILEGGTTVETAVTLTGTATKGQKVEVFDGTTSKGQPVVHATTGLWELAVNELSVAAHSFKAKALYGSGAESAVRTFTVADKLKITYIQDPQEMTVSPDGKFAYVGCREEPYRTDDRSLNLINLATQTITKTVDMDFLPRAVLSPDGRRIYVCAGNIVEYDATDLTLERTYTLKYHPASLALSPDNTRFYCVISDSQSSPPGKLEVIDIADGQTIQTIDLGYNVEKNLINPEGSRVYVVSRNSIGTAEGGVGVIDTSTLRLIDVIETGHNPSDMVASPDWEFLYVTRESSNELIEISTRTNKVTRRIPTKLKIAKLAITPDGKHLCGVGPENNNEATIFDTNTLNARPIPAGRRPSAVAFSKDGQRVYICNSQDGNLRDFSWL